MVTLDEVAEMALALPEVVEGERHANRTWFVGGKAFAWERPFGKAPAKASIAPTAKRKMLKPIPVMSPFV